MEVVVKTSDGSGFTVWRMRLIQCGCRAPDRRELEVNGLQCARTYPLVPRDSASMHPPSVFTTTPLCGPGGGRKNGRWLSGGVEPPVGFEPTTPALQERIGPLKQQVRVPNFRGIQRFVVTLDAPRSPTMFHSCGQMVGTAKLGKSIVMCDVSGHR